MLQTLYKKLYYYVDLIQNIIVKMVLGFFFFSCDLVNSKWHKSQMLIMIIVLIWNCSRIYHVEFIIWHWILTWIFVYINYDYRTVGLNRFTVLITITIIDHN